MKQLLKIAKKITILVLAISLFGCTDDDATLPKVVAGFTYTLNADTGTVTFINISENANTYVWTFIDTSNDDETSSTEINPVKTFETGEYRITLKAKSVSGASATFEDIIVVSDVGAPIITLLGNTTINITVGETFTDPGATAEDEEDGDITSNIVIAGDVVDVNTAGTYIITYNVSDAAGNAATERTRTVIVNEVVVPPSDPGDYLFGTSETVTIASTISDWGSGTAIVSDYSGDGIYNPCIQLTSGTGWGDVSAIAFTAIEAGKILEYTTLQFKIKTSDYNTIKVKMPGASTEEPQFAIADGTPLIGGWVKMSIPLSEFGTIPPTINEFAILEFGAGTMLITDVMFYGGGGSAENVILDFENNLTGVGVDAFESAGALIANPFPGGINTSPNVYAITYGAGNQWWGGVGFVVGAAALSDADTEYKVKLYSTVAPINVLFEVEQNGVGGTTVGNIQEIATANQWVEVTFTLQGGAGIDRVLIRPAVGDSNGTKTNDGILYVDDISSVEGVAGPACPDAPAGELLSNGGFEANNGDGICWQFNQNGGTTAISTEFANTGTYSAKLITGANQAPNIKMETFASTIAAGTTVQVTFKYRFTTALGTGSILQVLAFSEKTSGAIEHNMGNATDQPLNTWNTFTGTFVTSGDIARGISLLLQLTGSGNADGGGVVYIDDVQVTQL